MDEKRQVQKELFEDFVNREKKSYGRDLFHKKSKFSINLRSEHLVFILIGFIIALAVVFAFGVEKGKAISSYSVSQKGPYRHEQQLGIIKAESADSGQENEMVQADVPAEPVALPAPLEFTIQVASYLKEETAKLHADTLKSNGSHAFVLKKGDYYITCVGRFKDKQSADLQAGKLKKSYSDCIVRKI
jgi:hypothetical protein